MPKREQGKLSLKRFLQLNYQKTCIFFYVLFTILFLFFFFAAKEHLLRELYCVFLLLLTLIFEKCIHVVSILALFTVFNLKCAILLPDEQY